MNALLIAIASFALVIACMPPILATGDMGGCTGGDCGGLPSGIPDNRVKEQEAWLGGVESWLGSGEPIILAAAPGLPSGMGSGDMERSLGGSSFTTSTTGKPPLGSIQEFSQGGKVAHVGVVIGYSTSGEPIYLEESAQGPKVTVGIPQTPSRARGNTNTAPYVLTNALIPPKPVDPATIKKLVDEELDKKIDYKHRICYDYAEEIAKRLQGATSTTTPTAPKSGAGP